jgi:Fic family protein
MGPDDQTSAVRPTPSSGWPAVGYERLTWESPNRDFGTMARSEMAVRRGSYSSAIPADIATLDYAPARSVSAAAEDASNEIARFDAEMGSEIAPFAAILLRSESVASSQIENLSASARSVAMAELGDTTKQNATLIAANTNAMRSAIQLSDHLDSESILQMHLALLGAHEPHTAGRWREEPVWIGRSSRSPRGAEYVAPHQSRVVHAIDDLVTYVNREDIPVLEQAAIAHAQFETIHPFTDGNGRTGRALMHSMLKAKGLTRNVTVPVSSGLLGQPDVYHRALTSFRAGSPDDMIELTADAAFRAIANGRQLVVEIRQIRETWRESVTARADSATWRIADLLLRQPVLNTAVLNTELGITANHASRYMDQLRAGGAVTSLNVHRRGLHWKSDAVLDALDAFAARSSRRQFPTALS